MEGGNLILVLKIIVKQQTLRCGIKRSSSLKLQSLLFPVILYGCEVWGCSISRESSKKIEQILKHFIMYNLKIKSNTPCPILLIEVGISPIESLAMTRLLLYKHKINNMGGHRLPKQALRYKGMVKPLGDRRKCCIAKY